MLVSSSNSRTSLLGVIDRKHTCLKKKMSVSFQSFWVEGAGNTTEIQTLLTLTLLLYALQILPLLVRPNLNKFAPSNITKSPPSISGRSQSFTSFPDKTSYETNSRIHFDGGEFAIGRNFHRPKQLNKNEITEAIGGLFSGEKGELFVVCLEMKHEPPKTNTTGSDSKPKCFLQKHQVWSAF